MSDRPKPPEETGTTSWIEACLNRYEVLLEMERKHSESYFAKQARIELALLRAAASDAARASLVAALQARDQRIAELEDQVEDLVAERDRAYAEAKRLREWRGPGGEA